MKVIGLTGGIGSGKTTVAHYLESLGIPIYIADLRAREITNRPDIVEKIAALFGSEVVQDGKIDRAALASIVFNDSAKLRQLNEIIHPAVEKDFREWLEQHKHHDIVVKEAAILFETGSYKSLDAVINVSAPEDIRIERVMSRDNVTREQVLERMKNQFSEEKRQQLADFNVLNINISQMKQQINDILKKLRNL